MTANVNIETTIVVALHAMVYVGLVTRVVEGQSWIDNLRCMRPTLVDMSIYIVRYVYEN